jgi:hypothetical protein
MTGGAILFSYPVKIITSPAPILTGGVIILSDRAVYVASPDEVTTGGAKRMTFPASGFAEAVESLAGYAE